MGAGLFLAKGETDRQMDRKAEESTEQTGRMTLILAFHNVANTPKNNTIEENIV